MRLLQNFQDLGQDAQKQKKKWSFQDHLLSFFFFPSVFSTSWKESLLACTNMPKALRMWMRRVHPSLRLSLAKVQFNSEQRFGSCSQEQNCEEQVPMRRPEVTSRWLYKIYKTQLEKFTFAHYAQFFVFEYFQLENLVLNSSSQRQCVITHQSFFQSLFNT